MQCQVVLYRHQAFVCFCCHALKPLYNEFYSGFVKTVTVVAICLCGGIRSKPKQFLVNIDTSKIP